MSCKGKTDPEKDIFIHTLFVKCPDLSTQFRDRLSFVYNSQANVALRNPDGEDTFFSDEIMAGKYESYSW